MIRKKHRKKCFIFVFAALSVISFAVAEVKAAPCYGTSMLKKGERLKAVEANIIFNRDLDKSHGELESSQYFLDLSYGFTDRISIDLKVGAGDILHRPDDSYKINYDAHFAGGYGFRVLIYDDPKRGLKGVCGFQHISVHPPTERSNGDENKAIVDDWQISALISKDFSFITPYLGAKVSRCDIIHTVGGERGRKKSDDLLGVVLGTDIKLGNNLRLNMEGRAIDETAFSARLDFLF